MRVLTLSIDESHNGSRVGNLLRRELGLSAAGVRRAKQQPRGILLDGMPVFTTASVRTGQLLSVAVGDTESSEQIEPVPGPLEIFFEDEDILILDKPGRVPVHPSQGHHGDTLANFLMYHYRKIGLTAAFHPVNRLDRGTSGLLAVAKHAHAHERLQAQLHGGAFVRRYLAVCEGILPASEGTVEQPIRRMPGSVLAREVHPDGDYACTHYQVLRTANGRSLVELELDTGRTHQIRVHMAWLGCPLAGDFLYGTEIPCLPDRFALHSASLSLCHPVTGETLTYHSELPAELSALLDEEL